MRFFLASAGALSIVVVIAAWALLVSVGFAFIFWPKFPADFANTSGESQAASTHFVSAFYYSLAALTTLGSTEFTPKGNWVRIISSVESLIGIFLVTASISWVVLIYPALGRMRTLARLASTLVRSQEETGVDLLSGAVESLLADLAQRVLRTRVDFIHFPPIYYFQADTEGASLGRFLVLLQELAGRASKDGQPKHIRLGACLLRNSLQDLAEILARKYVGGDPRDPRSIFEAVSRDHLESK